MCVLDRKRSGVHGVGTKDGSHWHPLALLLPVVRAFQVLLENVRIAVEVRIVTVLVE